jgi:hypothetical protein
MEGKPTTSSREAIRAALLRLAVAHNRAVLAGMTIGLAVALAIAGAGLVGPQLAAGAGAPPAVRLLSIPIVAASILIGSRAVRLHRRLARDLGPARAAAAEVAAALLERGGAASPEAIAAAVGPEAALRGAAFLVEIGLLLPEGEGGAAMWPLDAARLGALLDGPAGPR